MKLIEEFDGNPNVSFMLIDNSGEKAMLVHPSDMKSRLYSGDGRFADMDAFIRYTRRLIQTELEKKKAHGRLIHETEEAFESRESHGTGFAS